MFFQIDEEEEVFDKKTQCRSYQQEARSARALFFPQDITVRIIEEVVQEHRLLLRHEAGNLGSSCFCSLLIPHAFLCICNHRSYKRGGLKKFLYTSFYTCSILISPEVLLSACSHVENGLPSTAPNTSFLEFPSLRCSPPSPQDVFSAEFLEKMMQAGLGEGKCSQDFPGTKKHPYHAVQFNQVYSVAVSKAGGRCQREHCCCWPIPWRQSILLKAWRCGVKLHKHIKHFHSNVQVPYQKKP